MDYLTTTEVNTVLYICILFWTIEKLFNLDDLIAECVIKHLRSLFDKRSSRSSSEERDDSSELPEDINSRGQVSPSKANPGGFVSGNQ